MASVKEAPRVGPAQATGGWLPARMPRQEQANSPCIETVTRSSCTLCDLLPILSTLGNIFYAGRCPGSSMSTQRYEAHSYLSFLGIKHAYEVPPYLIKLKTQRHRVACFSVFGPKRDMTLLSCEHALLNMRHSPPSCCTQSLVSSSLQQTTTSPT